MFPWEYIAEIWNYKIEIGIRFISLNRGRKFGVSELHGVCFILSLHSCSYSLLVLQYAQ